MRDKSQKPNLETGHYRHFKGGEYEVIDVIPNWSREDEWMVLYKTSLGQLGVRYYDEFVESVQADDEFKPRFEKMADAEKK